MINIVRRSQNVMVTMPYVRKESMAFASLFVGGVGAGGEPKRPRSLFSDIAKLRRPEQEDVDKEMGGIRRTGRAITSTATLLLLRFLRVLRG
jgi:hypothetical protein